jgi:predicted PurR-regulated permease PerM
MKPQYFVAILFATSLYWMYLLYAPYLLGMTIAALLAISTANMQNFFEKTMRSKFLAALTSSILLAVLFFVPLGYFLVTLSLKINTMDPAILQNVESVVQNFLQAPPSYLAFLKPYTKEILENFNMTSLASYALSLTGNIGAMSASYLKNSLLVIVFYFFAHYSGGFIIDLIKRVIQMSVDETTILAKELSSVMSVVFYSIILNAMFQGVLFGVAISFMGYNGLLFGIMYGFASLIPVIGGVIMWLPFTLYEFSLGNNSNALFIALYSIVMISIIADTFIKPLIIKEINTRVLKEDDAKMNELVIFFAIIAGLTTFGFWGMILGPAITALFLTILKLFEARTKECLTDNA